ncbi:MAG: Rid family detoxifying hydrolase [Anaerolineae bacterium]
MRKEIFTEKGAAPTGPYSQAILAEGRMVFVSGQGPVDPETGEFRFGSFREQAELTFQNVTTLLEAAGTSWEHVVRVGVFLADLENFAEMNEIYKSYLTEPYPARTTVRAGLSPQMLIEVDCIAVVPEE